MCVRFRDIIELLDVHGNFGFTSIDRAERIGLLDALPDVMRHRSFHIILPDKVVESGADALPILIGLLPSGRVLSRIIISAPLGRRMLSFLYSVVARRHDAGLCKLPAVSTAIADELDISRAGTHLTAPS